MKRPGVKWLAAALLLASCSPMFDNIKGEPCQEQPPPDTAPKVGHVVFVSVNPATGVFSTVLIDMEKKVVVEKNGGKTPGEMTTYLESTAKLDPSDHTTLQIVMRGSPILGEVISRPVPPPPPPPADDFWLHLAQRATDDYRRTYAEADAAYPAALKK